MPFSLLDDPFAPPPRPSYLPQDEHDVLGGLLESSLGGLGYIGKVLDKTFGGRAVRGLLGGRPDELLSVLPLSDTLGVTDEKNAVQGSDLLERTGLITPGDDSFENQLAGFGAEVALDPATWIGAAVPKLLARGGNAAARAAGAGLEAATGRNPYTFAARQVEKAKAPVRALFDPSVGGAWTPDVQQLAQDVYRPALQAGREAAQRNYADAFVDLNQIVGDRDKEGLLRGLKQNAEGFGGAAAQTLANAGFNPGEIQNVLDTGTRYADQTRAVAGGERAVGAVSKEFQDVPQYILDANEAAKAANQPLPFPNDLPFPGYQPAQYDPRTLAEYGGDVGRRRSSRMSGSSEFQQTREDFLRGIPGGTDTINQLARDPRLSGGGATFTPLQAENHLLHLLTNTAPVAGSPAAGQAKQLARYLRELPPEALDKGVFSNDVLGSGLARQLEGARVQATGQTVIEGIGRFARPVADLEAEGVRHVRVPDLLNQMGLTHTDAAGRPVAQDLAAGRLTQAGHPIAPGPMGFDLADLRNYAVPEDVARDMGRIGQAWKTPEVLAPVVDMWDRVVNTFKTYLTQVFPAFHARNLMSGIFNMWRDGAINPTAGRDMMQVIRGGMLSPDVAAKLYPNLPPAEATAAFQKEMIAEGIAFNRGGAAGERVGTTPALTGSMLPGDVATVGAAAPRPLGQDLRGYAAGFVPEKGQVFDQLNPLNIAGVNRERDENVLVGQARKLGTTTEDWIRGTHYLSRRLMDDAPAAARASVAKYQIDYSDLTEFERNVMKRLAPWYTFSRKSLPPLLEDLVNRPAKVAGTTRLLTGVRDPGEFVPPYIAEGASIPLPGAPDGQRRYLSSFGLPMEDELVKTLGSALHGDTQRVLQQLFGMSQPFVKLPAEMATGVQMYSGRRLEDLKPYEFSQLGGLVSEPAARQASQVIANTPLSRFGSTLDKMLDERKGTIPTALNTLTGARVTDVETDKIRERAASDLLKQLLRGQPGVRTMEEVYVPPEQLQRLSPEQLQEFDLLKELEKRAAARAREKKRATSPY